jgi:ribose-phosphate pyrophosphokinase
MPGNEAFAENLSRACDLPVRACEFHRFPDGETYVRVPGEIEAGNAVIVCTLDRPDQKILPLYFLARHLHAASGRRLGLVAPYLAYMRQDRQFKPGEVVTSEQFAALLSGLFDWLVTVDPHLHRHAALADIYSTDAQALHAAPIISQWIRENVRDPLLIGPDAESEQWVSAIANEIGAPAVVLNKTRRGDRDVEVALPDLTRWSRKTPVLLDDIVSTARTMIEAVEKMARQDLPKPVCIGVHAVFAEDAFRALRAAGPAQVVTCNTIQHETNAIDVVPLISDSVRARL